MNVSAERQSPAHRPMQLCFGGTFDPIHNGHLRVLWEVSHVLQAELVRLIPCHIPPLKSVPITSPGQRLEMVSLAIHDQPHWHIDERELARPTTSFTIDTLRDLRAELGPDVAIVWLLGMDGFCQLDQWHQWRALTDYAHLLVVSRPGIDAPNQGPVAEWARSRWVAPSELRQQACGAVATVATTGQAIASSDLRASMRAGLAPRYLVPEAVCSYIVKHKLYSE